METENPVDEKSDLTALEDHLQIINDSLSKTLLVLMTVAPLVLGMCFSCFMGYFVGEDGDSIYFCW